MTDRGLPGQAELAIPKPQDDLPFRVAAAPPPLAEPAEDEPAPQNPQLHPLSASRENAPIPIDETDRDEVLAVIRDVFGSGSARDRETALREVCQALGYERLGPRIREILDRDLLTAVRRGILQNHGGELSLLCRSIEQYERDFLKEQFLAALGPAWRERDEAIRLAARHIGFRRTGPIITETFRSLINGLLRQQRLESDSGERIRKG